MSDNLKDFFGTSALDYGSYADMKMKYANNNIFLFVTNDPIANEDGYVIEIGELQDKSDMEKRDSDYYNEMRTLGHNACATGVVLGMNLVIKKMEGFIGGIEV